MKHKLILMMAALTLFANSCTTTDKPFPVNTPTNEDLLEKDPAAAAEAFMVLGEFAVTPVSAFLVGAVAAVLAADASGVFGRQTNAAYSFGKVECVVLPLANEVAANPVEQIGKMHNIGLNYINRKSDFNEWRARFANYDVTAWEELIDIVSPGLDHIDKVEMINLARQAKVVERIQTVNMSTGATNQNEEIFKLSLSANGKSYLDAVMNTVRNMVSSGKKTPEIADYVNGEITTRLNPENIYTTEEKAILAYLTVAKHSGYYWLN